MTNRVGGIKKYVSYDRAYLAINFFGGFHRVGWLYPKKGFTAYLGDRFLQSPPEEPLICLECRVADEAVASIATGRSRRTGYYFKRLIDAKTAMLAANIALGMIPLWVKRALLEGWRAPSGWKVKPRSMWSPKDHDRWKYNNEPILRLHLSEEEMKAQIVKYADMGDEDMEMTLSQIVRRF